MNCDLAISDHLLKLPSVNPLAVVSAQASMDKIVEIFLNLQASGTTTPVLILVIALFFYKSFYKFRDDIRNDMSDLKKDVHILRNDVDGIKKDVHALRSDVDGLKIEFAALRSDVDGLKIEVVALRNDVDGLKIEVVALRNDVDGLKIEVVALRSDVDGLRRDFIVLRNDVDGLRGDFIVLRKDLNSFRGEFVAFSYGITNHVNSYFSRQEDLNKVPAGSMYPPFKWPTVASSSPMTLTKSGKEIARRLNAKELADKYVNDIQIPDDASKLQIQEACFTFAHLNLMDVIDKNELEVIEGEIYEAGGSKWDIMIVYGVLFRDAVFKSRGIEIPIRPPETQSS